MVGTGAGAINGILIKGGEPLETACKVKTIVFDKTGTITQGVPSVTRLVKFVDVDTRILLRLVASAESASEHALAKAIVQYCESVLDNESFAKCASFSAVPGCGLKAQVAYESSVNQNFSTNQQLESTLEDLSSYIKVDANVNELIQLNTKANESKQLFDVLIGNYTIKSSN
jgi:Cu+-exporting ATPase